MFCQTKCQINAPARGRIKNNWRSTQKGDKSAKSRPRIWNCIQNNKNFGLPHKMKDTKFVFTKPLSKFPPDQNKPTNDVLNLNRQRLCRQLFGNKQNCQIFSYNVKLCFTKQSDMFYQPKWCVLPNKIQISRKTKAKPQAKMPDWDDEAVKPSSWEGLVEPLLWPKQASKKIFNLWLKLHYFFYKKWKRLCDENKRRRRIEEHRAFDPSAFTLPRTRGCTLNLSQKVVTSPAAGGIYELARISGNWEKPL